MRIFTAILAQMYEKNGLSIPPDQALDELKTPLEIDTAEIQKRKLRMENE